ncbi:MAG: radical SAM protein [Candidatus Woesearchaeota archaeon]
MLNNHKKVIFVEPTGAHSNVFSRSMTIPLLGPVYLATIASQNGFDASVFNENISQRKISAEELSSADILCLSCITATVQRGKEIAKEYKMARAAIGKSSVSIIGGIHASMMPEDVENDFDQVVIGEAEGIIVDVLSGKFSDKKIYAKRIENLDILPFPDFGLVKDNHRIKTKPVMTSRGCPFNCNFCTVTKMFGRDYRHRSAENIIEELSRYKTGDVFIVDDNFAANTTHTDRLLDMMKNSGFDRRWSTQVRTDVTKKPALVAKMKQAGCATVYIGFESVNPQSLKEMKKAQGVDDIRRSIKVFHDNGIMVLGMFIIGNDSDTKETFRLTSKFCRDNRIDFVQYTILTPLPGTELYRRIEQENRFLHKNWELYDALHVVLMPKNMTPDELQRGMIECFNDFYSYANALNDALNTLARTFQILIKKLYARARTPSFIPSITKLFGRQIIRKWMSYNRKYMDYLGSLSNTKEYRE